MSRAWGKREARNEKGPHVFRVGEVNRAAQEHLESKFSDFWVEGELSQVSRSRNGHIYFTLSDEREESRLNGILFDRDARQARAELVDGERVRVRGHLTLHVQSGRYQIRARMVLTAGAGGLAAQFERIRKRLAAEGLLDDGRKRELPRFPQTIGVVTSVQSAALRDIVRVAHARSPVRIVVADCRVSGEAASRSIVTALQEIQQLPELDLVILGRGGGSAEELWSFNAERVARAVAMCRVPVVCGVGHETDVTIAELVADRRASTPSNAAEIAVPERSVLLAELVAQRQRLERAMARQIDRARISLHGLERELSDPRELLGDARRRLRDLEARLRDRDPRTALAADRASLSELDVRLREAMASRIASERETMTRHSTQLRAAGRPFVARSKSRLALLAGRLNALSPLSVLERGYAIAFDADGVALKRRAEVSTGDRVTIRLHEGVLQTRVEEE